SEQTFELVNQAEYGIPAGHWRQVTETGRERIVTHFDGLWRPLVEERFDATDPTDTLTQTVTRYDLLGREVFASWPTRSLGDYASFESGTHTSHDGLDRVTA